MIKYQDIFDDFYLDFTTSLARLSQECENLYHKELHLPDHVLQEFFKDGGETWDDQFRLHFDQQVRTKIGKDYETYLKLFNSLRNYFDILRQKLGLDEQFQVSEICVHSYSMSFNMSFKFTNMSTAALCH